MKAWVMMVSLSFVATVGLVQAKDSPFHMIKGNAEQGGFVVLAVEPYAKVDYKKKQVIADSDGHVIIAFGRDDKPEQHFKIISITGEVTLATIQIAKRHYNVQEINGLPKNKVSPDTKTRDKIWIDIKKARKARKINLATPYFENGFSWPAKGIISGVYGSQRVLNGKPRRPHFGVDVAAPKGAPLLAPADGEITLVENMELSGHTVMIDHGYGLRSTVMHLSKVNVKKGDKVKRGEQIGEVGMTGRATGPHVHWGMSWFNVRLDPALSIQQNTKPGDKVSP